VVINILGSLLQTESRHMAYSLAAKLRYWKLWVQYISLFQSFQIVSIFRTGRVIPKNKGCLVAEPAFLTLLEM
jgi:hypothetical protein